MFKIAILADIHANLHSLLAVSQEIDAWQPDYTIIAGDLINRGPQPRACIEYIMCRAKQDNWLVLRGNHEDYVLKMVSSPPHEAILKEFNQPVLWTADQLDGQIRYLKNLPDQLELKAPDGTVLRAKHASMIHNRDGLYPETTNSDMRRKITPAPDVFITAHTHRPFIRQIDQTLVVNAGSAGLPFDLDTRAAYAQVTWNAGKWSAHIARVGYDVNKTASEIKVEMAPLAGPIAKILHAELVSARSLLYSWAIAYQGPILKKKISVGDAVEEYLATYQY
jgi:predicted phosphodiesterase